MLFGWDRQGSDGKVRQGSSRPDDGRRSGRRERVGHPHTNPGTEPGNRTIAEKLQRKIHLDPILQDPTGKKVLRLDYGFNVKTNTVDYHWNQKGTFADFGIADHTTVGRGGAALYQGARAFKYAGRALLVLGLAADTYSIVMASNPLRRSTQVVSPWALAWAGAETGGAGGAAGGAALGSVVPGLGTAAGGAVGGIVFGIAGGIGGYWAGSKAGAIIYDWAAETHFLPLPETDVGTP